jgi:hypothetical protein
MATLFGSNLQQEKDFQLAFSDSDVRDQYPDVLKGQLWDQ